MTGWHEYQKEAASFFRSIGLEAELDVGIQGARTFHDIDVVVRSHHVGFEMMWIVECKHWSSRVSKLHVLALREIVSDVGADRGVLLAEEGYQSGAFEAANLTSVKLTSLAELRVTSKEAVAAANLKTLLDRIECCRERYWELSKETRIAFGLRSGVGVPEISALHILDAAETAANQALRGRLPPSYNDLNSYLFPEMHLATDDPISLFEHYDRHTTDIEARLTRAETHPPPRPR